MSSGPLACATCGTPTVPGARFCFQCGAPLDPELTDATAERRLVTVVFGDLSDFTAWAEDVDPERVGVVTDRVLAALTKAVSDVGGHVDKLTGDGIMAVFGAPVAHEDDPERAVRAAAAMQTAVRRLVEDEVGGGRRLGLRVGINTGEVLAGMQASVAYTVVGDTVNTAARLSDAAGVGTVVAGRETALGTVAVASWRALAPLRLKGKRDPVEAYELVALRPAGSARLGVGEEAPFIGRDAELGLLVGRLLDVVDRAVPASVFVTGDAGIGKTRLVAELSRVAGEVSDTRVLWGRCRPYGEGRDLGALADWVRTALGVGEADEPDEIVERVRRALGRLEPLSGRVGLPGVAEGLLPLLGVDPGKHPAVRDTTTPGGPPSGGDVRQAALSGLLAVLAAAGPLILIVDDLHWASPALLAALRRLGRELTGRTLLVCVGRSDVLETAHEWTVALPAAELLLLAPLDEPAADRLLRAYLGGAELEPPARALLLDRAQGNPFFLAELLHLLVDRGLLRRVGAGWRLEQDVPAELLPAGVQAVLAARIDGLDPVAKAVLRDAAVLGARFPVAALLALEAGTEDAVRAALDVLVSRGLLEEAAEGDTGPAYVFRHGLARDVAYAGIPKADRARRHAAAALWAAHDLGGPAEEVDSFVARQAERAVALAVEMGLEGDVATWGIRPVGAAALLRLGQAAVARDEDPAALELLGRALDLDGADPAVRLPALVARAAAHAGHSRLDEATADLPEPLSSADGVVRAGALVVAGTVARRRGEEDAATAYLVSALAAASEAGTDRVTSEALRELGLIAYFAGRLTVAEQHFRAALELAERVGDRRGAGWALQQLSWSATTRGDYREAERALLRAADVFAGLDDAGGLSWCAGTEAFVRLLEGRIREARRLARGLVVVAEGMGERFGMAACLTIDAYAAAELGELTVAGAAAQRAYDEFVALGDTWGQGLALVAWAVVERGSGQPEQAVIRLERAVALAQAGRHAVTGSLALGVLGYAQLDAGDAEAAEATALRAMAVLAELDLEPQALVMPRVLLGMALRAQGRLDRALDLLAAAAADADSPSLLFPRRQALAHWAGALLAAGEPRSALAVAEQALAVPAEDVRSRVVALRVLAGCYAELGDAPAARFAAHQALGVARASELVREIQASEQLAAGLAAPAG